MGHPPDREVLAQAAAGDTNDRALEHLDALSRAFDDLCVHAHRVARTQRGHLLFLLLLLELLDHIHLLTPCGTRLWAACSRRHCLIRAWSPERSTSGTFMPRYSAGRVNCGQPVASSAAPAKLSWAREPGSPTTPGTSLATASTRTIAGISPPLKT